MTLVRLGILPWRIRGRRTSISMPFTPITTTRGLGFEPPEVCANRNGVVRSKDAASVLKTLTIIGKTPKCRTVAADDFPSILPESMLPIMTIAVNKRRSARFSRALRDVGHAGDQKRIFNANWIWRPSLALVILPTVVGLLMLLV